MSPYKALGLVFVSTICGGLIGIFAGWLIATRAPDYYAACFPSEDGSRYDPMQLGFGLGITQGMGAGLLIGLILMGMVFWREMRTLQAQKQSE